MRLKSRYNVALVTYPQSTQRRPVGISRNCPTRYQVTKQLWAPLIYHSFLVAHATFVPNTCAIQGNHQWCSILCRFNYFDALSETISFESTSVMWSEIFTLFAVVNSQAPIIRHSEDPIIQNMSFSLVNWQKNIALILLFVSIFGCEAWLITFQQWATTIN